MFWESVWNCQWNRLMFSLWLAARMAVGRLKTFVPYLYQTSNVCWQKWWRRPAIWFVTTKKAWVQQGSNGTTKKAWVQQGKIKCRGLTSHSTHYRSFRGRFLQVIRPNQQCQSTEGNQLVFQIRLESHQDGCTDVIQSDISTRPPWDIRFNVPLTHSTHISETNLRRQSIALILITKR